MIPIICTKGLQSSQHTVIQSDDYGDGCDIKQVENKLFNLLDRLYCLTHVLVPSFYRVLVKVSLHITVTGAEEQQSQIQTTDSISFDLPVSKRWDNHDFSNQIKMNWINIPCCCYKYSEQWYIVDFLRCSSHAAATNTTKLNFVLFKWKVYSQFT